jgi:hypothetical protein
MLAMSESSEKEPAPEDRYLKKMLGIIKSGTHRERINALLLRIKARLPELEELARTLEEARRMESTVFTTGPIRFFTFKTRLRRCLR